MGDAPESYDHIPVGELVCPEPDERPDIWPWSALRNDDGELVIGGLTASAIADNYGTPLFVQDAQDFEGRAGVWATAMAEEFWDGYGMNGGSAFYAAKAFLSSASVRTVAAAGLGVDTASLGELSLALKVTDVDFPIGLHGNNKTDEEIRLALTARNGVGINRIFIDSAYEVEQITRIAEDCNAVARVMIRVKSGVHAGGNAYISTGHEDQKFGVGVADGQLDEVLAAIAASPRITLLGLHSHIGSQIHGVDAFVEAASIMCRLLAYAAEKIGHDLGELDLGGGAGIAYNGNDPLPLSPMTIARVIADTVRKECTDLGIPIPEVSVEPGRSIAGNSMVTLYRVGAIKDSTIDGEGNKRRYVSIDGGMSDNIRPALYGARYTATVANRRSDADLVRCRVVGKHCESGDVVVWDVDLPADITAGDILAVPATGAYGYSMTSNYNMLTKPGVLQVGSSEPRWIMRPQTIDDLLSYDTGL